MWLACSEVGLGGVWIGVAPFEDRIAKVKEILNLPDTLQPFAILAYGYPDKERQQQDRWDPKRIHVVE